MNLFTIPGFVDKAYLKKHMTFHDQSKFYVCETCGKSFNNVLGLAKHCKTHRYCTGILCKAMLCCNKLYYIYISFKSREALHV